MVFITLKKVVLPIFLFLLVVNIVNSDVIKVDNNIEKAKVDKIVEERLQTEDEVSVIVVLKDDYSSENELSIKSISKKDNLIKKKLMVEKQQDKVLSGLDYEKLSFENGPINKSSLKIKSFEKINKTDFKLKRKFSLVNGFAGSVTEEGLENLRNNPDVKFIYENKLKSFVLDDSVPLVNATNVWKLTYDGTNITGKGESICVVDSGIDYTHPALGNCTTNQFLSGICNKVIAGVDFKNNDADPIDDQGHGTHVAGIIASENETYRGVAPDATLIAIKVCDNSPTGNCEDDDIVSGIEWCVDNASIFNISAISISLGAGTYTDYCNDDSIAPAINTAVGQNISVVIAAGNNNPGDGVISSPACVENATPVGAVDDNDAIQFNRNSLVKLLTPSINIISTLWSGEGGNFGEKSGTSMSTPHAAAAFALIRQFLKLYNNSVLPPDSIEDILNETGKAIVDGSNTYNRINVYDALSSLDAKGPVISFVAPTPANNSIIGDDHFFVNITSDEVINTALFEFNGTNTTMNGSSTNWYINKTNASTGAYTYKVYGNDSFGNLGVSELRNVSANQTMPQAQNVTLNSSDFLNKTNGTLTGSWNFFDPNNDVPAGNETKWYNNTVGITELTNYTTITSNYTKKNQNWAFSVRVYDGSNWSNWVNSSILEIKNTAPEINITTTNIEIDETQLVNISLNASDMDNDVINFTINSTLFSLINNQFLWYTNLSDGGNYNFNVTVNDTKAIDSVIVAVTVVDVRDADNDGNPDFNDTDDDNDGIDDEGDFLLGNLSSINTSLSINITINGTADFSQVFNGTYLINITNNTHPIIEFNWTFNSTNLLDFYNITFDRNTNGSGKVSIKGVNLQRFNKTKVIYVEKLNASVAGVCIKDAEADFTNISSNCDGDFEYLVNCNNETTSDGYACYDTGSRYKITGLNHSAVTEACRDNDGDGYGTYCTSGSDCDDNDASKNIDCSSGDNGGNGGGGGGGGGSGGGGGGGAFFTCNMDWKCSSWSECIAEKQTRTCSFVKVPQHTQGTRCSSKDKPLANSRSCEAPEEAPVPATEQVNETESEKMSATPAAEKETKTALERLMAITGAVVGKIFSTKGRSLWIDLPIIGVIMFIIVFYVRKLKRRNKKDK